MVTSVVVCEGIGRARAAPASIGDSPRVIREEAGRESCGRAHSLASFAAVCVDKEVVPLEDVEVEVEVEASGGGVSSAGALAKYRTGVLGFRCSA